MLSAACRRGALAPGTILWRAQLTAAPCYRGTQGILSTPVIDLAARLIYVVACDSNRALPAYSR